MVEAQIVSNDDVISITLSREPELLGTNVRKACDRGVSQVFAPNNLNDNSEGNEQ